ncbi:MAG TPA: leucyl aminopeptidase [Patescibacteria group bacterium]|nr:leucyl aminopeptidase [Patescibacteria group bacterium]
MKISLSHGDIKNSSADTIIVNLFAGVTQPGGATRAVDNAMTGAISEIIASGDLTGEAGEVAVLYPRGAIPAQRVLIVGLGKSDELDLERVRKASASAILRARQLKAKNVATIVHGAGIGGLPVEAAGQATIEGTLLALYRFDADKKKSKDWEIETFTVVEHAQEKIEPIKEGIRVAEAIASGTYLARDLVNMPPNIATPTKLAETAGEIAKAHGMGLIVGDRRWAAERKMGAFLAVAKGAGEPPMFIVLEHNSDRQDLPAIVLVGKGITFDTGGISIKPGERMWLMKSDMAGAAAVLGTMQVVGLLNLPLRIISITPCTENMPDANAYRPADVIKASNGKTIEVLNTDAEGRMVLADGLVFAKNYKPAAVVDLATLTGACVIALGQGIAAGLFSTDDSLRDMLVTAGAKTHERLWPLPLWDDYKKAIESQVADIQNTGGRFGGVATSAVFLKEFTDYAWAHLDIAGMAFTDKDDAYTPAGGTGFGVRLLTDYLRNWQAQNSIGASN